MNVKKAIKRIAALAAGTTMVTATIMGAMAYDLGDYPMPYVKDGVFNGNLVIGKAADVTDVIGAIDIAASLQAAAKTPVSATGATTSVSVTGGVQIETNSADLNFGDDLVTLKGDFDDDDFPELLADGEVKTSDDEYGYEQTIALGSGAETVALEQDGDYGDDPFFALDISGESIVYLVDFDNGDELPIGTGADFALDGSTSASMEMFGAVYTLTEDSFDAGSDELTLYGSDTTVLITQGSPVTVEVSGEEYTLEVVGGTTDGGANGGTVNLKVTGDSTEVQSLEEGDNEEVGGLDVYVDDIIASTIGEESIAASIFVGSNELILPVDGAGDIDWNGDDDTGITANVVTSGGDAAAVIETITFTVPVVEFENPAIDDDWEYLVLGETFEDPLFGFSLDFASMSPSVEGRNMVELSNSGTVITLDFVTNDGDDYSLDLFEENNAGTFLYFADDMMVNATAAGTNMSKDNIFILESSDTDLGERTTYIFECTDIDDTDGVELKDLISGESNWYEAGDEIADTAVDIEAFDEAVYDMFNITGATLSRVVTQGGLSVSWVDEAAATEAISFLEDAKDGDNVLGSATAIVYTANAGAADADITLSLTSGTQDNADDEDADVNYAVTSYGTWFEMELEDDKYVKAYYAETEVIFGVLLNGPDAVVVTSTAAAGTAYNVNEFVVGQIAVYDSDAMSLIGKKPLIVVGGPCANTVAMNLLGNPEVCWEGFSEGKAVIKSWDAEQAILVAGYSGEDTTGAARVLADYDKYNLVGDEVEVIVTDLENLEVNAVN